MTDGSHSRFADALSRADEAGLRRTLPTLGKRSGPMLASGDTQALNLSSNDYLGLAADVALHRDFFAGADAVDLDRHGMGASASRLLTGNHPAYTALEEDLCALYGGRHATVFSSGYHANVGICSALAEKGDLFLADKLCHASLIDGMRLSGAKLLRYRHLDYDHLERLLVQHRAAHRDIFIVSESVFSMDGDTADISRLVQLKRDHRARLLIDEAHAVGVFGDRGLGVCEREGCIPDVDLLVGTFGKALGSFGAFAVTDGDVRDYLVNHMRPFIFTTALPPSVVNWSRTTLARSATMQRERTHLHSLAGRLREALRERNITTGGDSQIVPAIVGPNQPACDVAESLRDNGFLAFPIRPPTVPPGTARLRFSLSANMDWDQIKAIPDIVAEHLRRDPSGEEKSNVRC